jgi:hypothetical protein
LKDGRRNGQGTVTLPDGSQSVGEWKMGHKWNLTEYINGNIVGKFVNGNFESQ